MPTFDIKKKNKAKKKPLGHILYHIGINIAAVQLSTLLYYTTYTLCTAK